MNVLPTEWDVLCEVLELSEKQKLIGQEYAQGTSVYIPKLTKKDKIKRNEWIRNAYYKKNMTVKEISKIVDLKERKIRYILSFK